MLYETHRVLLFILVDLGAAVLLLRLLLQVLGDVVYVKVSVAARYELFQGVVYEFVLLLESQAVHGVSQAINSSWAPCRQLDKCVSTTFRD